MQNMQHMREILGAPLITYDVHNQPDINGSIVIILDTHNCVLVGDTTHYLKEEKLFQINPRIKTNLGEQFSILVRNIVPYDTFVNSHLLTPEEKHTHDPLAISHMANKIQTIKNWLISKTTNHPQLEAAKAYIAEHIPPAVRQRIDAKSVITAEDQDQINRLVPNILQQRIAFNSDKKYEISYGSPNIKIWSMLNIQSIKPGLPFPKGNIDRRENSSACALREVFEETGIQLNEANLKKSGHYKILPGMQIPELRKYEIFYYFLNAHEEANAVATITRKNSSSVAELHNLRFDQLLNAENIKVVQEYNCDENCADPPNWGQEGRAPWAAAPGAAGAAAPLAPGAAGAVAPAAPPAAPAAAPAAPPAAAAAPPAPGAAQPPRLWDADAKERAINSAFDARRRLPRTIDDTLAQMREHRGYHGGYYEKYIKYKTKYLELKNMKN